MKAIETRYKGFRFRSRLEARWAVFFDAAREQWLYEPEGYEFSNGIRYLPDFYLPRLRTFVEVKGPPPTETELDKARRLSDGSNRAVIVVGSDPNGFYPWFGWSTNGGSAGSHQGFASFYLAADGLTLITDYEDGDEREVFTSMDFEEQYPPVLSGDMRILTERFRSARFEYGER